MAKSSFGFEKPSVKTYNPTLREKVVGALTEITGDSREANRFWQTVLGGGGADKSKPGVIDVTPLSIPFFLEEAGRKLGTKGQRLGGAADVALSVVPIPAAAKGAKKVVGLTPKSKPPIVAYHGSPHTFDKFDSAKIGTGEGAQVYGHGLYFAENEEVARAYRDALRGKDTIPAMNARMKEISRELEAYQTGQHGRYSDPRGYELKAEYDRLMDARDNEKGSMYQVGIDADPAHFLDWDLPLREQHPFVQDGVSKAADRLRPGFKPLLDDRRGMSGYTDLSLLSGLPASEMQSAATSALREAGIPGIKYFDLASRGPGGGTRNFVVFNPEIVSIMRRYGVAAPVAAAMLAGAVATPDQARAAPATPRSPSERSFGFKK